MTHRTRVKWYRDALVMILAIVMVIVTGSMTADRLNDDPVSKSGQARSSALNVDPSETSQILAGFDEVTSADFVAVKPSADGIKRIAQVKTTKCGVENNKKYCDQLKLVVEETPPESATGVNLVAWSPVKGTPSNSGCRTITAKLIKQRDYFLYKQTFYVLNNRVSWCWMIYGKIWGVPNKVVYQPTSYMWLSNLFLGHDNDGPPVYHNKFIPVLGLPYFMWDNFASQKVKQCLATKYICNYVANPWINVRAFGNGQWQVNKGGTN